MTFSRCPVCFAMVGADATVCDVCGSRMLAKDDRPKTETSHGRRRPRLSPLPRDRGARPSLPRGAPHRRSLSRTPARISPLPTSPEPMTPRRRSAGSPGATSFFVVDFDPLPASAIERTGEDAAQSVPGATGCRRRHPAASSDSAPSEARAIETRADTRKPDAQPLTPTAAVRSADDTGTTERPGLASRRAPRPDARGDEPDPSSADTRIREPRGRQGLDHSRPDRRLPRDGRRNSRPLELRQDSTDDPPSSEERRRDMSAFEAEIRASEARLSEARRTEGRATEGRVPDASASSKDSPPTKDNLPSGAWRRAGRPTPTRPIADPWSADAGTAGPDVRNAEARAAIDAGWQKRELPISGIFRSRPGPRGLPPPPGASESLGPRPTVDRPRVSDESREPSVEDQWAAFMAVPSEDYEHRALSIPWRGLGLVLLIVAALAVVVVVMFSTGLNQFWESPPSAGGSGPGAPRGPRSVNLPVAAIPRAAIPAVEAPTPVPAATPATAPAVVEPPVAVLPERVANRPEPEPQQPLLPIELPERRPSVSGGPAARASVPQERASHRACAGSTGAGSCELLARRGILAGGQSAEDGRVPGQVPWPGGCDSAQPARRRAVRTSHAQGVYWSSVLGHVQTFSE